MYGPTPPRNPDMISFAYGLADPDLFPRADPLAATADVLSKTPRRRSTTARASPA
jgi:hypothetical protein